MKSLLSPVVTVVVALCTAFVLWRGASLIVAGAMTVGALTVFLAYLSKFFKPVQDLAKMTNSIAAAAVALERIQGILDTDNVIPDRAERARARQVARGEIAFEHVAFGYDPEDADPARRELHHRAGTDGRRRRHHRWRQVDGRRPDSALLRRRCRTRAGRRRRRARLHQELAAQPDRLRAAGHGAVPWHDPREHRLRPARRHRGRDHRGREARQRARLHRAR